MKISIFITVPWNKKFTSLADSGSGWDPPRSSTDPLAALVGSEDLLGGSHPDPPPGNDVKYRTWLLHGVLCCTKIHYVPLYMERIVKLVMLMRTWRKPLKGTRMFAQRKQSYCFAFWLESHPWNTLLDTNSIPGGNDKWSVALKFKFYFCTKLIQTSLLHKLAFV